MILDNNKHQMDILIKYIADHTLLQDEIIYKTDEAVPALYSLLLYHGHSVDHFLKTLFRKGFEKSGIYFFRESTKEFTIIAEFLNKNGGNFDALCQKICDIAFKEKMDHIEKDHKKFKIIITKIINILDELLVSSISDTLIDFCSHICLTLNNYFKNDKDPTYGEKIMCSFLFFRIIGPKILKSASDIHILHVIPLIKKINIIALDDNHPNYEHEHQLIRNIIARLLMKRKNVNYCFEQSLTDADYKNKGNILVTEMQKYSLDNILLDDKIIIKKDTSSIKQISHTNNIALPNDLRYFLLWSVGEIISFGIMEKLDIDFLGKWQIDGKKFMQLSESVLQEMGLNDKNKITKIIECIDNVKKFAIWEHQKLDQIHVSLWSGKDMILWLILSNMQHLVNIFLINNIGWTKLIKMDQESLLLYGITQPKDIIKLIELKKRI